MGLGKILKSVAKFALPVVGNLVAPGIGGILGGAVSGAIGGGGLKGALLGGLSSGIGNFAGGALSQIMKGTPISTALGNSSFFGMPTGGGGALSKILGKSNDVGMQAMNRIISDPIANPVSGMTQAATTGSKSLFDAVSMPGSNNGTLLSRTLDGLGLDVSNLKAKDLVDFYDMFANADPKDQGLITQQQIAANTAAYKAKQARDNELFLQSLNAAPLNRQQVQPAGIDYATYGQNGGQQVFFDNVNPAMPVAGYRDGGLVRGRGTERSDSVLARLSKNEYVVPAHAVRKIGKGSVAKGAKKLSKLHGGKGALTQMMGAC